MKNNCALLVVLCSLFLVLCGCLSHIPTQTYNIQNGITIYVMDPQKLQAEYDQEAKRSIQVNGFAMIDQRKIFVPYSYQRDIKGNYLPDFEVLGHEIWHMLELGGRFHP